MLLGTYPKSPPSFIHFSMPKKNLLILFQANYIFKNFSNHPSNLPFSSTFQWQKILQALFMTNYIFKDFSIPLQPPPPILKYFSLPILKTVLPALLRQKVYFQGLIHSKEPSIFKNFSSLCKPSARLYVILPQNMLTLI